MMYQPYTADMARLAAGRMTLKARICEGNARHLVSSHRAHWEALALDYRREASAWQAMLNTLAGQECA